MTSRFESKRRIGEEKKRTVKLRWKSILPSAVRTPHWKIKTSSYFSLYEAQLCHTNHCFLFLQIACRGTYAFIAYKAIETNLENHASVVFPICASTFIMKGDRGEKWMRYKNALDFNFPSSRDAHKIILHPVFGAFLAHLNPQP